MTKNLLTAAALAMAPLLAQPAFATTITGQYSLSISNVHGGWSPTASSNLSDDLSSHFSESLASVGSSTGILNFYTATPPFFGFGSNDTATITVTFTNLSDGTSSTQSSYSDTATWLANYNNETDSITWSTPKTITVDFKDNLGVNITLIDASDWAIVPKIQFTLIDAPAPTPEPGSLALLGAGLAGLGLLGGARRRRSL